MTHNIYESVSTLLRPLEALEAEHQLIQRVITRVAMLAEALDQGAPVGPDVLVDLIEFLRTFVCECHHAKEERILFPLLESRGIPAGGCPIGTLHHEHEKARALLAQLAMAADTCRSDASGRAGLSATLRSFAELYPEHIWKENYLLLPMAAKMLSAADLEFLAEKFENIEREIGAAVHQRLEEFPERLDRFLGTLRESQTPAGSIRVPEPTGSPVLAFDLSREIERLRQEPGWQAGRDSKTLVKHPDFRMVLTAIRGGTRIHEHRTGGRISVQTLTGHIQMHVPGRTVDLAAGHVLALDRAVPHDVEALEDSAFLLTIARPEPPYNG